jgi:predicted metalloendopeptidase
VAWEAYKQFESKHGAQEQLLPDIDNDRLFFIAFAQTWCVSKDVVDPYNVHSPPRARVIGCAMNSESFSDSFKCPVNSSMNPKTKCMIWDKLSTQ